MQKASQLRVVAVGTAAENKKLRNDDGSVCKQLMVTPHELQGFNDGDNVSNLQDFEFDGTTETGQAYQGSLQIDTPISCDWLPYGSNRVTPPDVRRNERIEILQVGNSLPYYWRPYGLDDNLRKLETIVFAISATPDESQTDLKIENCYFLEMSSHLKRITLQTSKGNGEPFGYQIQVNAGEGMVTIQDDVNNRIILDSTNTEILARNANDAYIQLTKRNIFGKAPERMFLEAGNQMTLTVGGTKVDLTPGVLSLTSSAVAIKQG